MIKTKNWTSCTTQLRGFKPTRWLRVLLYKEETEFEEITKKYK